jgi:hypothetical protein
MEGKVGMDEEGRNKAQGGLSLAAALPHCGVSVGAEEWRRKSVWLGHVVMQKVQFETKAAAATMAAMAAQEAGA